MMIFTIHLGDSIIKPDLFLTQKCMGERYTPPGATEWKAPSADAKAGFMAGMEDPEQRAEQAAFWARLSKSGPEAVDAVKKLMATKDAGEKSTLIDQFNEGKPLEKPYAKDGIDLPDGSRIKVNRDQKGNINLGFSS